MSLSKFEKMREKIQRETEALLIKIEEEEKRERERRVGPLTSKYTNLFESVLLRILKERVEDLEFVRFKKAEVKKRLEDLVKNEIQIIIDASKEEDSKEEDDKEEDDKEEDKEEGLSRKESDIWTGQEDIDRDGINQMPNLTTNTIPS